MEWKVEVDSSFVSFHLVCSLLLAILFSLIEISSCIGESSVEEWNEFRVLKASVQQLTVELL